MSRLLHLSDLHFGAHDPRAVDALVALAHELLPDVIVCTGDLTQRAWHSQFDAFVRFRERMPVAQWLLMPGNHDLPWWPLTERVLAPHRRMLRATGQGQCEQDIRVGPMRVISVDSTRWWRHQYGRIAPSQVQRVVDALQTEAPATWRIVACHHPLRLVPQPVNPHPEPLDRPWGHRHALSEWAQAGVDLVLCGHIHVAGLLPPEPLAAQAMPPAAGDTARADGAATDHSRPGVAATRGGLWVGQTGSATSWRLPPGKANAVVLIEARAAASDRAPSLRWSCYELPAHHPRFIQSMRQTIRRQLPTPILSTDTRLAPWRSPIPASEAAVGR